MLLYGMAGRKDADMDHMEEWNNYQDQRRLLSTPQPAAAPAENTPPVMGHVSHEELWHGHYQNQHAIRDLETNTRADITKLERRLARAEQVINALMQAHHLFHDASVEVPDYDLSQIDLSTLTAKPETQEANA